MSILYTNSTFYFPSVFTPIQRGYARLSNLEASWQQRLPTDSTGTAVVTFVGVLADSEIRVYNGTTELAGTETCIADQVLSWPAYGIGSPNNNVIIRIVHQAYKIKVIPYTAFVGPQGIPIQQEPDRWFNNPV